MKTALPTYLHDHLAGAVFGVELVDALEDDHGEAELGQLARTWKAEILADRAMLRDVADCLGAESSPVKEMISWVAERHAIETASAEPERTGNLRDA